jgi:ribosomal-protein-alanine N-acetyltransferase
MAYFIRLMEDKDIPQTLQLDREAYPNQWPRPTYTGVKHELRNRLARYLVAIKRTEPQPAPVKNNNNNGFQQAFSYVKHLFDHDRFFGPEQPRPTTEYIVGMAGFWIMVDEAHITTLATREAYRRQGVGEWLLIAVIEMALELKASVITLEVRTSNKPAQELYQKYAFKHVGLRRRYYSDNGEDALIMTTDTLTSDTFKSYFAKLREAHRERWSNLYAATPNTMAATPQGGRP